ncbi:hypothetical protein D3C85_1808930 [compost metagenome]
MIRQAIAREMMVAVEHMTTGGQQRINRLAVLVQTDIQRSNVQRLIRRQPMQQANIPLDPGYQHSLPGLGEAQL